MRWFGRVQRRNKGYTGPRTLEMQLSGRRRGRPHRCSEGGHGDGWCNSRAGRAKGEVEADDPLW